jgi:short-subunit dehydrogenase
MALQKTFSDKTILVTGGAAGIGRAVCAAFAAQGAHVYAADINEQGVQELAQQASSQGRIEPIRLDVSQQQDFKQAIDRVVADHGQLDILVNNAGIVVAGAFSETSQDEIEKIVNINLWSVLHGSQLAYRQMLQQGHGQIVNVSSSGGLMPVPNQTMYSAIKHAVVGFSHSLREEAALHGIKINTVFPGMVQSDLWDSAINVKDYNMKKSMENTGLKPIPASEAAAAILKGIEANDRSIIFPKINKFIVRLYQLFPVTMTKFAVAPLARPDK